VVGRAAWPGRLDGRWASGMARKALDEVAPYVCGRHAQKNRDRLAGGAHTGKKGEEKLASGAH
jgi:hypothetical protein